MRINSLALRNIACFEDVTFTLGSIVLIQSANGMGKSTLIAAIKYLFGRGHDPDFLRGGAEEGEIVAEMEDGTKVRAALTKDKTDRMYKPVGQKKWNRSREFIETMTNALSFDPLQFLLKSEKDQVSEILRLMPVEVSAGEMDEALEPIKDQAEILEGLDLNGRSPLDVVNTIRSTVYEARTTIHIAADTHEKHAGELDESLKAITVDGTDWKKETGKLQVQLAGIDTARERLHAELTNGVKQLIAQEEGKRDKLMLLKEGEINDKISALRQELGEYKNDCKRACESVISDAKTEARQKLDGFDEQQANEKTRLTGELATAEQSYGISLKLGSTRDAIGLARKEAGEARVKWKAMTLCLENIDKLKANVASRLPIPCTIADGRICREENGALIPFHKWNDASRWTLALKIATLCHGQAGFVCIDSTGFDAFDPEHRKAFLRACQKYVETEGMQFVCASVSSGDLKVLEVKD